MFLAGCVVSCGVLLVVAGLSKVYRGARRMDGSSAIWRALRIPRRLIPLAELAVGGVECLTGAAVCARIHPAAAGAAMAVLGGAFCLLLGYVRVKGVPGGCGCVGWRRRDTAVTGRAVVRAALLPVAGIADAFGSANGWTATFYAGLVTGGVVLTLLSTEALLSTEVMPRTPRCHRPLWRPAHTSMRALTAHEVFAAMASAAGPLGSVATHRRSGCADEFWFPATGDADDRAVLFRVSYAPGGVLTVHASVRQPVRQHQQNEPNLEASSTVVEHIKATDSRRRSHAN
jgi:hypothetical protein